VVEGDILFDWEVFDISFDESVDDSIGMNTLRNTSNLKSAGCFLLFIELVG
jgi:hypothetical protein